MKEIEDIIEEIIKKSTGCFRDKEGTIHYLLLGEYHREKGPAYQAKDGYKEWWYIGNPHRSDGPTIEFSEDHTLPYYYYYGYDADSKEQFYDPEWRRKIEIKVFL